MNIARKVAAVALAAGALVGVAAVPASATTTTGVGTVYSWNCNDLGDPNRCLVVIYHDFFHSEYAHPYKDAYIFDCSRYGVPQDSTISGARLRVLKEAKAKVKVVWDRPYGYRDYVVCV